MRGAVTNSLKRFCLSTNFICKILSLSRSWSFRNETSNQGAAPVNPLCIHFRNPVHPGFLIRASLVTQTVKNLPVTQETQVKSMAWEDPLGKGMATHSNILAWRIPWTEEAGRLWFMVLQRVGHNCMTFTFTFLIHKRQNKTTYPSISGGLWRSNAIMSKRCWVQK